MNFLINLFFNLCDITPPAHTTSDSNGPNTFVIGITFIVIVVIILVIIGIKLGRKSDDNKANEAEKIQDSESSNLSNQAQHSEQNTQTVKSQEIQSKQEAQKEPSQQTPPAPQQVPEAQAAPQNNHGFLKFFIKLLLLVGITFFAFCNYRIFEINKGWSIVTINNKSSYSQVIDLITDIEKVEYYQVPHSCNSNEYKVHISTSTKSYLFDADEDDIKMLNTVGIVSSKLKPQSVFVIPFYIEVVVGLIIIIIPFGRKR